MDRNVSEAARLFDAQEAANEHACYTAAHAHGHSQSSADNCEAGDRRCPACPWKDTAENWKGPVSQHFNAPVMRWLGWAEQKIVDRFGG